MASTDASLARQVVLALIVAQPRHGWAIQKDLAKDGAIGRMWSLSRQLTYKAIDSLVDDGLVTRSAPIDGHGGDKVVLSPTAKGRKTSQTWLDAPVTHLRDVRTELLVKLSIREQMGLDNGQFIAQQINTFEPLIASITKNRGTSVEDKWRRENAKAVSRFLHQLAQ